MSIVISETVVPNKEDLTLSLDAFVRSTALKRSAPHALFIGAGRVRQFPRALRGKMYPGVEAEHFRNE